MKKIRSITVLSLFILNLSIVTAQKFDPEYVKVTNERAAKIVKKLDINDQAKQERVTNIVAEQYRSLSAIQDPRDQRIEEVKKSDIPKEGKDRKIEKLKKKADKQIAKLHKSYIKSLSKEVDDKQIVQIKDGMTYGVVEITYAGYQDMLPSLSDEQKKYIYDNLVEAREHAIDAGSSKAKHAWFGKYKGRINNYLSSQGYDLHKESIDWQKRLEDRKQAKNN